jgi:predicted glycogen debranching enzyme
MIGPSTRELLPEPLVVGCQGAGSDELLGREWLVANKLGAYASATVLGTNTRRYHGLLVAATRPPASRILALSCLLDQLALPDEAGREAPYDLANFEFEGAFLGSGEAHLVEFRNDLAATFVYRCGVAELIKEIILAEAANAVAVRYRLLSGPAGMLRITPFVALRDVHGLRLARKPHQMTYLHYQNGIRVEDRQATPYAVHLSAAASGRERFCPDPQWWYRFRYRGELARGQEGFEDLYTPGRFELPLAADAPVQLTASLDDPKEVNFDAVVRQKRARLRKIVRALGPDADQTTRRLAVAGDAFVTQRKRPNAHPATTIVAGYHWFADWGRDALIALPGLLLETGQFQAALAMLRMFAESIDQGMVPNFFNEYGTGPRYNSIDASLWFVLAAESYVAASSDQAGWQNHLAGAVEQILRGYHDGTRCGIHADADALLEGGDRRTQLTWMDAKLGEEPVTPRDGKCVEINALWHAALRIAARRADDPHSRQLWQQVAEQVAAAFQPTFWNEQAHCLYDCVRGEQKDPAIRPNQIIAVALPDCPLAAEKQRSVVEVVRRELLTPYGLRTLSPADARYRGWYGRSGESRDRAYHQGTVWPWLMGPFIQAYLKVNGFSDPARAQAGKWLAGWDQHLPLAGVGYVSEIFDGNPPHAPAGCIAQAWSVAELLRAKRMVARGAI